MPRIHTVTQGESLSSIALRYGFRNWHALYEHSENAAFRKKRPNPNLIVVGDQLVVPDIVVKNVQAATGKTHQFKAAKAAQKVEFKISITDQLNPSEPVPGITATLMLPDGSKHEAVTDADGTISLVEPAVTSGTVDILQLRDTREAAILNYDAFVKSGLSTNQSHALQLPDKRKIIDRIAAKHAIIRRAGWGARRPNYSTMAEDWEYTTVVIHHSGNSGETDPKEIERKHMDDKKWDDVGYHYLITPTGLIHEGRHLAYKGSHVEMANTKKIGILIMGDFETNWWDDDDEPTAAQIKASKELITTLKAELGTIINLGGHRDYKTTTECPGDIMYGKLGVLRTAMGLGGP